MSQKSIKFLLAPEKYLPVYVTDTKQLYEHRNILKQLLLDDYSLNYLLDILLKAVEDGVKFRTLDCLKVMKAILRNNFFGIDLDNRTKAKLFDLFKNFVFHKSEDVQSCANLLVRFQSLDDNSVSWLISHWDRSNHILNRLLRYPKKHPLITAWAESIYRQGLLADRRSELIALLIDESIPTFVKDDSDTIIWAIYYSRVSDEVKQRLLKERFSFEHLDSIWEVALRLRYNDVLTFMRSKVRKKLKDTS